MWVALDSLLVMPNRIIAVGDIHGEFRMLELLMNKLDVQKKDELIFVGDYIDRGPDSKAVINEIIKLKRYKKAVTIRGNHESMALNAIFQNKHEPLGTLETEAGKLWAWAGAHATIRSYEGFQIPRSHIEFMAHTQKYYMTEWASKVLWFVHGGFDHAYPIEEQLNHYGLDHASHNRSHLSVSEDDYIWNDNDFMVCGHTPSKVVRSNRHMVCIDTGATFKNFGALTAIIFNEDGTIQFRQVHREEVYEQGY